MPRIRVGEIEIYYQTDGKEGAPWVVLIPGFSAPLEMWGPQIPALRERYRILTYDMRGHGRSDVPFGGYDLTTQSDDLLGIMDSLGVETAYLVGDAAGGCIAVETALRRPERVSSLILIGTRIHGWDPPADSLPEETDEERRYNDEFRRLMLEGSLQQILEQWWLGGWSKPLRGDPIRRRAAQFRDLIMSYPAGAWRATVPSAQVAPHYDRLPEIPTPALIVTGGDDLPMIKAHGRQWCESLPNAEAVSIPEAGHAPSWEFPKVFNDALLDFLDRLGTDR